MSEVISKLNEEIENGKANLRDKYLVCRISAKKLAAAHKSLSEVQAKVGARGGSSALLSAAEKEHKAASIEHADFLAMYDKAVNSVLASYEALEMAEEDPILAKKTRKQAEKFAEHTAELRDRLDDIIYKVKDFSEVGEEKQLPTVKEGDFSAEVSEDYTESAVITLGERLAADGAFVVEKIAAVMEELKSVAMSLSDITSDCIKLVEDTQKLRNMKAELQKDEEADFESDTPLIASENEE